jgi:glycyl-tRNA synthetase
MVLCDAYWVDEANHRTVLKLSPNLAPYAAAVFPLVKNNDSIVGRAKEVYDTLKSSLRVAWDDRGNIGKRYMYQDEIGTPFCVTIDHDTLVDSMVTVRDRDTMKQERVAIDKLKEYISAKLEQ